MHKFGICTVIPHCAGLFCPRQPVASLRAGGSRNSEKQVHTSMCFESERCRAVTSDIRYIHMRYMSMYFINTNQGTVTAWVTVGVMACVKCIALCAPRLRSSYNLRTHVLRSCSSTAR